MAVMPPTETEMREKIDKLRAEAKRLMERSGDLMEKAATLENALNRRANLSIDRAIETEISQQN
jgi:hypothetical protein